MPHQPHRKPVKPDPGRPGARTRTPPARWTTHVHVAVPTPFSAPGSPQTKGSSPLRVTPFSPHRPPDRRRHDRLGLAGALRPRGGRSGRLRPRRRPSVTTGPPGCAPAPPRPRSDGLQRAARHQRRPARQRARRHAERDAVRLRPERPAQRVQPPGERRRGPDRGHRGRVQRPQRRVRPGRLPRPVRPARPCTTANGCFKKVNQNGGTTSLPANNSGWAGEISLDLDMVSAICPNAHIILVEANTASTADLGTAVNEAVKLGAKFVSNSYGGGESARTPSYDTDVLQPPGRGHHRQLRRRRLRRGVPGGLPVRHRRRRHRADPQLQRPRLDRVGLVDQQHRGRRLRLLGLRRQAHLAEGHRLLQAHRRGRLGRRRPGHRCRGLPDLRRLGAGTSTAAPASPRRSSPRSTPTRAPRPRPSRPPTSTPTPLAERRHHRLNHQLLAAPTSAPPRSATTARPAWVPRTAWPPSPADLAPDAAPHPCQGAGQRRQFCASVDPSRAGTTPR